MQDLDELKHVFLICAEFEVMGSDYTEGVHRGSGVQRFFLKTRVWVGCSVSRAQKTLM